MASSTTHLAPVAPPPPLDGYAVAAFACALAGVGVVAIVCAVLAHRRPVAARGGGMWMATAGVVVAALPLVGLAVVALVVAVTDGSR